MLRVERFDSGTELGPGRAEWDALFDASPTATPFQSWEWTTTWWLHFGRLRRSHVLGVFEGADLVGLAPLYLSRGAVRVVRPMGVGHADYLHPLAHAGREVEVAQAIRDFLVHGKGVDLVDWPCLRETQPLAQGLRGATQAQEGCPQLTLPTSWEAYVKTLSKSMRYEAKRLDKAPFATAAAHVRAIRDPGEVPMAIGWLFDLHARRWKRRGLPGAFASPRVRAFHTRFTEEACRTGRLRLSLLEHEGAIVGAIYAMAAGRATYFYQSGFDPSARSLSPGSVLVAATIRDAIAEGHERFDFLRGEENYKLRWAPQVVERNMRIVESLRPGLAVPAARLRLAGGRLETRLKAKFAGKGLIG